MMMSDYQACCAHRKIVYVRVNHKVGTCSDRWHCVDCGKPFTPRFDPKRQFTKGMTMKEEMEFLDQRLTKLEQTFLLAMAHIAQSAAAVIVPDDVAEFEKRLQWKRPHDTTGGKCWCNPKRIRPARKK